jgi:microsomal epoxide hydrolase
VTLIGTMARRSTAGRWLAAAVSLGLLILASAAHAQGADRYFDTSDGVRLHYTEAGHGRTLVFVPGWTMPGWIFRPQLDALSASYHVVLFDPRGQGSSDIPEQGYDQTRRGQDIAELLDQLGPDPVVLVGWSLGVLDTLAYVARSGDEHIAGLVLVDNSIGEPPAPVAAPPPPGPRRPHGPRRSATCSRAFVVGMFARPQSPEYLDRLADACGRTPAPAARALLAYPVPRTYWRDAVLSTTKPVLYVIRPHLQAQAQNLLLDRPNDETVLFPTAGHALFVDEPERFNQVVADFLSRRVWPG